MFRNLIAELARHEISTKELAAILNVTPKTINNKIAGRSEFTLPEILKISSIFPALEISFLFARDSDDKTA